MQRKIIPDIVKRQSISSLKPENTVFEAATMMASANIGAVIILDKDGNLTGIITERDRHHHRTRHDTACRRQGA
jgi:CBS domain-containing protein